MSCDLKVWPILNQKKSRFVHFLPQSLTSCKQTAWTPPSYHRVCPGNETQQSCLPKTPRHPWCFLYWNVEQSTWGLCFYFEAIKINKNSFSSLTLTNSHMHQRERLQVAPTHEHTKPNTLPNPTDLHWITTAEKNSWDKRNQKLPGCTNLKNELSTDKWIVPALLQCAIFSLSRLWENLHHLQRPVLPQPHSLQRDRPLHLLLPRLRQDIRQGLPPQDSPEESHG